MRTCPADGVYLAITLSGSPLLDGKYQLQKRLGQGGMGSVYQALHLGLNRLFALKLVLPVHAADASYQAFFRAEALALGRLRHPGIVGVTDFGVDPRGDGVPYLVMEYLEGQSLADLLQENGPLQPSRALPLLDQIARAVDHAHRNGVLHRDLKPANIFIAAGTEDEPVVKVVDFGLAHLLMGPRLELPAAGSAALMNRAPATVKGELDTTPIPLEFSTRPLVDPEEYSTLPIHPKLLMDDFDQPELGVQEVVGTPGYLAPEVLAFHPAAPAADVYSFGMMTYQLLAGRLPFDGTLAEILAHQKQDPPPDPRVFNPVLPKELVEALLAPLAKQPRERPATLCAVVAALRRALNEHALHEWARRELPRRKRYSFLAALAGLMLAWAAIILSPVRIAEERLEDLRMELVAPRPADPRIMLVSLDEATLDDGAANFFERADRLVQGIEGLYKAGVKSVALDLILPRRFSESEALSKLVLMRRQQLVLGLYATQGGQVKGWECLSALTRSVFDSSAELGASFGLVNLEPGADGRIRTFRTQLQATDGSALEPLAVRVYHQVGNRPQMASEVVIDHSVNPANFARAAWNDIPALLAADPEFFRGRLVLLGVDSPLQEDVHAIPSLRGRPGELSGLAIHALILQTLLNGRPIKKEPVWISLLAVMAMGGTCAWYFLREPKAWKAWLLAGGALAAYSFLLLALGSRGFLLPMAGPLVTTLVIIGFAALARQFLPPIPDAESLHAS